MVYYVAQTILYKVENNLETPIAEDESEKLTDISDAVEEFESRSDAPIEDCVIGEVPELELEDDPEEYGVNGG